MFATKLRAEVGTEYIDEVNRRNATPEYDGLCASHDFCDANQVMVDALKDMGREFNQDLIAAINEAWSIAKNAGFDGNAISLKPEKVKLATLRRDVLDQYEACLLYTSPSPRD